MPKFQTIQNNFNTGEISPFTLGRSDIEKYHSACEALQNYIPLIYGGCARRPGSLYIATVDDPGRLVPFQISSSVAFILEFSADGNIRFYKNQAQIQVSPGVAYQIAHPYTVFELFQIKFAQFGDIMYLAHPNHPVQKLNHLGDQNWVLSQPAFKTPPLNQFDQDVGTPKSANLTPAAVSGLAVNFTASATVFIAGDVGKEIVAGTGVATITSVGGSTSTDGATGATLFSIAQADIINSFQSTSTIPFGSWFLRGNPGSFLGIGSIDGSGNWRNSRTLGPGTGIQQVFGFAKAPLDSNTQADSTGGAVAYQAVPFADTFRTIDVGGYIVFDGAVGFISGIASSHQVGIELRSVINVTFSDLQGNQQATPGPPGTWSIQTPSFQPAGTGFPNAVCFFQDRLCFAGTTTQPQTVWMSVTDDYENFAIGTDDDDSVTATINSGFREQIQWLAPYQGQIVAGTLKSEYIITGGALAVGGNGPAITPSNVTSTIQSSWGVANIQPVFVENDLIYIQRSLQRGFQFAYDIYRGVYASKNLNIFHNLITTAGFQEMIYWQSPFFLLVFNDKNGNVTFLTYNREQDVWAWSRMFTGVETNDAVQSIATIINPNQLNDDLWMCVKRFVNGSPVFDIELIDPSKNLNTDCTFQTTSGSQITSVSGLTFLQGRSVSGVLDVNTIGLGDVVGPFTVPANGIVSFKSSKPSGALTANFGLNYTSTLQTVRLDVSGAPTIQGFKKRWARIFVRLYQSLGLTINGTVASLSGQLGSAQVPAMDIPFRTPSEDMGVVVAPTITNSKDGVVGAANYPWTGNALTGDVETTNLDYDYDGRVLIQQTQPLPSVVLALFGAVTVGEM